MSWVNPVSSNQLATSSTVQHATSLAVSFSNLPRTLAVSTSVGDFAPCLISVADVPDERAGTPVNVVLDEEGMRNSGPFLRSGEISWPTVTRNAMFPRGRFFCHVW